MATVSKNSDASTSFPPSKRLMTVFPGTSMTTLLDEKSAEWHFVHPIS
jgi:hypothetical protein